MNHIRPKGYWDSSLRGYSTDVIKICNCTSCTNEWLVGDGRSIVGDALVNEIARVQMVYQQQNKDSSQALLKTVQLLIKRALESEYFDEIETVEQWRRAQ